MPTTNPEHHHSFHSRERRYFFGKLSAWKLDYELLCAWLASVERPRPSAMDAVTRAKMLRWLGNEANRARVLAFRAPEPAKSRRERSTTTAPQGEQDRTIAPASLISVADCSVIVISGSNLAIVRNADGYSVHKYLNGDHVIARPVAWFADESDARAFVALRSIDPTA